MKVSIEGNGLCTSVHYKHTYSHNYLLYLSSHLSHVKNSIAFSQFLKRHLCNEDSDFPALKSEEMCDFFDKRGYPASVVQAGLSFKAALWQSAASPYIKEAGKAAKL